MCETLTPTIASTPPWTASSAGKLTQLSPCRSVNTTFEFEYDAQVTNIRGDTIAVLEAHDAEAGQFGPEDEGILWCIAEVLGGLLGHELLLEREVGRWDG